MSLQAIKYSFHLSQIVPRYRNIFANSLPKILAVGPKNTRTVTRSLFILSRNSFTRSIGSTTPKTPWSNTCSCGCSVHTEKGGDEELAAFLADEIENERKAQPTQDLPQLEGFECVLSGAEVTLRKKWNKEIITIKSNVNNSVDAEETVMDPNETKEPPEAEMKSKPEFTVEIQKGKKVLSFLCSYNNASPDDEPDAEPYNDTFQITELSLYEGEFEDSTYSVSGDIMDGYLYDLLMNYLEDRGISNGFADQMIAFFTSYEHKLYVSFLQGMKSFIEK